MTDQLKEALSNLEEGNVLRLVNERLDAGDDPLEVIASCREGMADVGKRFEAQEYYLSELIMAGEIFKEVMTLIGEKFETDSGPKFGTVVIGTVEGDIHDIGKDIVISLLQAANYNVIDLGVDVPADKFVEAVKESGATVVGLSGLLTIAFDAMENTIDALEAAGLRTNVKVMIGGGSVTDQVCEQVGADALGVDAHAAVTLCEQWILKGEG